MKIKDVVCAAGSTGFYFDDQRAIKRGAGHDGMFYIGQPVTEGFSAVRMKGEAEWKTYAAGESFNVPGNSSFDIEVAGEPYHYICHFG